MSRRTAAQAAETRSSILECATALGSVRGLESLSYGTMAEAAGLTRGGVSRHFRSKEELQLAAVEAAAHRFREEVWSPAADARPGVERLRAVIENWLSYLERDVFPGGCFLTAAALEFDGRRGRVRDAVAATFERWLAVLGNEIEAAQAQGELSADREAAQIAFEINGHVMAGNWGKQLFEDPGALDRARAAIEHSLNGLRPAR